MQPGEKAVVNVSVPHPSFSSVCVFERKKRGRSYTAEVIVCVTTGQNLIVRLLSRWAAGVIGLSSRLPCPRAPRMTLLTVGGSEEPNTGSASIAGTGERPNICLKRKRGGRKRDLFEQKQLETPPSSFALDWRSCSVPNNRSLSLIRQLDDRRRCFDLGLVFSAAKLCTSQGRCLMNVVRFICSFYLM